LINLFIHRYSVSFESCINIEPGVQFGIYHTDNYPSPCYFGKSINIIP
jgi:hypothetical protein